MTQRLRFKQLLTLEDRLRMFSDQLKAQAAELRPGPERDALLKRARVADTASRIDEWPSSPGLRPK
jgi:cell division protein FtsB